MIEQRAVQQSQIQNPRLRRESQSISSHETRKTIRPLHELVSESRPPFVRVSGCVADCFHVEPPRVPAPDDKRESIVESERRHHLESEPLLVLPLYAAKNRRQIAFDRIV